MVISYSRLINDSYGYCSVKIKNYKEAIKYASTLTFHLIILALSSVNCVSWQNV